MKRKPDPHCAGREFFAVNLRRATGADIRK